MRSTVALAALFLLLGLTATAWAQLQFGNGSGTGVYIGQQGGVNVGYGGRNLVGVAPGGDVRVGGVPSRIANNVAHYQVQQPLPNLQYHPPQASRVGLVGRLLGRGSHVTTPGYYSQPYTWYEYKYFPVANSSLYAPGNIYPYGYTYDPAGGTVDYYTPPYDLPADPALRLGIADPAAIDPRAIDPAAATAKAAISIDRGVSSVRSSNAETRRRAALLVESADGMFRRQRYHEALQQYKTASRIAPDVAAWYFRQGHALTAVKRYELAADAFKRGLALDPTEAASTLTLDTLYHDARLAKHSQLDTLAATTLARPDDANLMFVLGVFLHFDGQADRAEKFFERAAALSAPHDEHVRPFLHATDPAATADASGGTRT